MSSSSSSGLCPNNISQLTTTIELDTPLSFDSFLSLNINDISGDRSNYIELYSGNTSARSYDHDNIFFGLRTTTGSFVQSKFVSILINGTKYYLKVYSGDSQTQCCSNLVGDEDSLGDYLSSGFALIEVDGVLLYTEIFLITQSSSSSSIDSSSSSSSIDSSSSSSSVGYSSGSS